MPLIDLHVHNPIDRELRQQLDRIERYLAAVLTRGVIMSEQLDRLTREVAETKDAVAGAATRIGELAQEVRDAKDDPAKLDALADELDQMQTSLKAAVDGSKDPAPEPPAEGGGEGDPPVVG